MNIVLMLFSFVGGMCVCGIITHLLAAQRRVQAMIARPTTASFLDYADGHPNLRFWQALASWSGHHIFACPVSYVPPDGEVVSQLVLFPVVDTYEWTEPCGKGEKK